MSELSTANPRSLDELFNADPLTLARSDRSAIVSELRHLRVLWAKGMKEKKADKKPKSINLDENLF